VEEEQSVVGKELAFGLRLLKPYTNTSMHLTCLCTRESILAMMFNDLWNQTQGLQARIPNPSEILQGGNFFLPFKVPRTPQNRRHSSSNVMRKAIQ